MTWKNTPNIWKAQLEGEAPEFKTQVCTTERAERITNCLALQRIINTHSITREGLTKMGGRSALQRCPKRTS